MSDYVAVAQVLSCLDILVPSLNGVVLGILLTDKFAINFFLYLVIYMAGACLFSIAMESQAVRS